MSTFDGAAKSVIMIITLSLGSKFLGFFREILIAAKFGSGMETDTFFIAMSATTLLTSVIGNAITTTFIPILSEVEVKEGKKGKIDHTNNMLNIVTLISIILVIIAWIFSPIIVKILAKGFYGNNID